MLQWVDSRVASTGQSTTLTEFSLSPHAWFEGDILKEHDQDGAVRWLVEKGLLHADKGSWGAAYQRVGITSAGQDCVTDYGADVMAYLEAQKPQSQFVSVSAGAGSTFAVTFGDNSPATAVSIDVRLEEAAALAAAIREAAPVIGLQGIRVDPELAAEVQQALADLEARDEVGRVKRGLNWFGRLANNASAGALGNLLGQAAAALLRSFA